MLMYTAYRKNRNVGHISRNACKVSSRSSVYIINERSTLCFSKKNFRFRSSIKGKNLVFFVRFVLTIHPKVILYYRMFSSHEARRRV